MYCSKCEVINPDSASFCKNCGYQLNGISNEKIIKFKKSFQYINQTRLKILKGLIIYSIISNILLTLIIEKVDPVSVLIAGPIFIYVLIISIIQYSKKRIFILPKSFNEINNIVKQYVFLNSNRNFSIKEFKGGNLKIKNGDDEFELQKTDSNEPIFIGEKSFLQDFICVILNEKVSFLEIN